MTRSRIALLVAVAVTAVPVSLVATAYGHGPAAGTGMAIHRVGRGAARVRSYWTQARMRRAIPVELLDAPSASGSQTLAPQRDVWSRLGAGSVAPTRPDGSVRLGARSAPKDAGAHVPTTLAYPFTSGAVPTSDYRTFPYSTIGRVFFTDPTTGLNYSCSGTAISSTNESVVWTAGHCVHGGGAGETFYTNWQFVPSYVDHTRPAGSWPALALLTTPEWAASGNLSYDMAAAVVAPLNGHRLTEVTGGRGIRWNQPQSQTYQPFGYPAAAPFTGERIYYCLADYATSGDPGGSGPATMGIGCDMTQGSSGGGWVVDHQYVESDVSYGIEGQPNVFYGPYFGDDAATLYQTASTSTAPGPLPSPSVPSGGGPSPTPSDATPSPSPSSPDGGSAGPEITDVVDRPDPFSPNGDGVRDKVKIYFTVSEDSSLTMTLFNRNGAALGYLVKNLSEPAGRYYVKWNGKNALGRVVKNGTYGYTIGAVDASGNKGAARGTVTVAR